VATDLIPSYPTARFALLGPIAARGDDGQCAWRIIIRCHEGEMLTFHQVALGPGPIDAAEQMKEGAEALFRSSGYEVKQSPTTMDDWTATWEVVNAPGQS
jgi:hypothetical protein